MSRLYADYAIGQELRSQRLARAAALSQNALEPAEPTPMGKYEAKTKARAADPLKFIDKVKSEVPMAPKSSSR